MNNEQTTQSYPFIIHKGCIYQYNGEVPEGATVLNAPNIDTAMGYVSEEYLNQMLAEKDKTIKLTNYALDKSNFEYGIIEHNIIEKDRQIKELKDAISLKDELIEAYRDRHETASKIIDLVK